MRGTVRLYHHALTQHSQKAGLDRRPHILLRRHIESATEHKLDKKARETARHGKRPPRFADYHASGSL